MSHVWWKLPTSDSSWSPNNLEKHLQATNRQGAEHETKRQRAGQHQKEQEAEQKKERSETNEEIYNSRNNETQLEKLKQSEA